MKTNYQGHSRKQGVYQIRNLLNKKVYIGSAKEFKTRYKQHLNSLIRGTHHNKHLQASFQKHGSNNFIYEVIETTEKKSTKKRREVEQKYIDEQLENWKQCYNLNKKVNKSEAIYSKNPELTRLKQRLVKLGKKRGPHSEETKRKIGLANSKKIRTEKEKQHLRNLRIGIKHTKETKLMISKTMKEKGLKPPSWLGKHHSEETKLKLAKSVRQLSINGELIKIHKCMKWASQELSIDNGSIVKCCKNRSKTAGGYKWEYDIK